MNYVPKELVVDTDFEDMQIMSDWLSSKKGSEGSNNSTQKGDKKHLLDLVRKNAFETIKQKQS